MVDAPDDVRMLAWGPGSYRAGRTLCWRGRRGGRFRHPGGLWPNAQLMASTVRPGEETSRARPDAHERERSGVRSLAVHHTRPNHWTARSSLLSDRLRVQEPEDADAALPRIHSGDVVLVV